MKKLIVTTLAAGCLSLSAFSQGSIIINEGGFSSGAGVTTQGAGATSTSLASTYFSGTASFQVWYAASSINASNGAVAANAYDNVTGGLPLALAILTGAGYSEVASGTGNASEGYYTAGTVDLPSPVPTGVNAYLALVVTDTGADSTTGWAGVLAFLNNTGGSYTSTPAGTPVVLQGWDNLNENLVLSPVPEPTTLALGALGGLSLLLFRRKQS